MDQKFSPDLPDIIRWLEHGQRLAMGAKGWKATHRDVIWELFAESLSVVESLPDQDKRWLSSGTRSGGWNMIGLTPADLREIERLRILSAMTPHDGATRAKPETRDIDRAMGVLDWLQWCRLARNGDRLVKAAIALSKSGDVELVHRIYRPNGRTADRRLAYEIRTKLAGHIMSGLRERFAIEPVGLSHFRVMG